MQTTWITDGTGVCDGGDTGGDVQVTDSYSVRFWRKEDGETGRPNGYGENLFSLVTINFYGATKMDGFYENDGIARDSEGQQIIWMTIQTETMICADRDDPGSTERHCDYQYEETDYFFGDKTAADKFCREFAEGYDEELANRDLSWDGLAAWERSA